MTLDQHVYAELGSTHPGINHITNPEYRSLVEQILSSGLFDQATEIGRAYQPRPNHEQIARETSILDAEFVTYGIPVPEALTQSLVSMRALMLPTETTACLSRSAAPMSTAPMPTTCAAEAGRPHSPS